MAVVSLVDKSRIWFKARYGLDAPEIKREPGLCASALYAEDCYEEETEQRGSQSRGVDILAAEAAAHTEPIFATRPPTNRAHFILALIASIQTQDS